MTYINKIRTTDGDLQIDYEALANLPVSDTTLTLEGSFADAKVTGDKITKLSEEKADKEHTHDEYLTEHQSLADYAKKSDIPTDYVKTINGVAPDGNGNVVVAVSGGTTEVCPYEEVNSIDEMTDTSKQYLMNGYVYSYKATSGVEVPNFTNQIPISTDADGNVYNGCGYKDETRFNSSNTEASATGRFVTGFIPVTNGDVIRFGDMKWDTDNDASHHSIIFYNDKSGSPVTKLSAGNSGQTSNMTKDSEGCVTQFTAPSGYTYSYFRVSSSYGTSGSGSGAIITKNEEIAYRVTDGTAEWVKGEKWTPSNSSSGSTSSGTTTEEVAIPEYWKSHLDTKIATVKELQDAVGDDLVSFPFFTDLHCNANPSYNLGRNIGLLSNEIMNRCDISFAVCGGDTNSNGNVTSKDAVESCVENAMDIFAPIKDRLLLARGNHDITYGGSSSTNNAYQWQYSPSELYNKLFRWQATDFRRVFDTESDGTYFYVDDKSHKTRFIILDSQWVEWQGRKDDGSVNYNGHHNSGYGQRQLEWLSNVALQFDEEGWIGVIVTHVPPTNITYNGSGHDYLASTRDGVIFKEIVNAFCNKTSYEGTYTGTAEWQNVDISVDFAPRKGNVACVLSGHCHVDRIIEDELPCPIITFTCASNIPRTGEETETRTFGTTNETAFDIVSIDRANNKIYMTRVGIGSDRECSYRAEVSPYTLVPETTVDFSEEQWVEMGGYLQESNFMFEQGKSYKVVLDGVGYVCDEVFNMSDDTMTAYAVGNTFFVNEVDNGIPFTIATVNEDGVVSLLVMPFTLDSDNNVIMEGIHTFSVMEIVEEDLPVYKCTIGEESFNGTLYKVLKGISLRKLRAKQRTIELDGKLYISEYSILTSGETSVERVFLTRVYSPSELDLYKETILFYHYLSLSDDILGYVGTYVSRMTWTLVSGTD